MFRKLALVSALVLSLSGCGLVSVTDANHMDHGMMDDNNSQYSSNDLMFAQMMIPHHQQAIEMSNLAETRATNKEVLSLARTIKAEQAPEIEQMKSWLKAAGQSEMGMEDHMGMGMLTEEEITGAMIRAVKTGTRKICFTLDSGEHSLADTGRDGYSALKELVEKANYETATLNLLKKRSEEHTSELQSH